RNLKAALPQKLSRLMREVRGLSVRVGEQRGDAPGLGGNAVPARPDLALGRIPIQAGEDRVGVRVPTEAGQIHGPPHLVPVEHLAFARGWRAERREQLLDGFL